jgi:UDP-3-O-[3-hydroxymyristoyl] glucosamine N-acyltransferase
VCSLDEPHPDGLSLIRDASPKQLKNALQNNAVKALFIQDTLVTMLPAELPMAVIAVNDPMVALISVIPLFFEPYPISPGISEKADVHPSAKLGHNVTVSPFVSIGANCVIGDNVVLHPQVTVYPGCTIGTGTVVHAGAAIREDVIIGEHAVIQNGAIIGADGFGYVQVPGKGLVPVPQIGTVVVGNNAEVGANSCIDRATLGKTRLGDGSKADNLVQIGHNTAIGNHSILCGQVGIAGSCSIGNGVVIGGGAGVKDHVTIADGVRIAAKSGVTRDLREKGDYGGYPAVPVREWHGQVRSLIKLTRSSGSAPSPVGGND